ncbi:uncharacterized protein LOC108675789 [Hyalella azteca]|uniref:Uncharacterized protein LOC108675789 n=1 Tax=Hyalella azteca TaxID=294128 RepID=A0A8B7P2P7_HYAAZ|nr:uncharacterized protein LOC108675789 [Hyalella azteca]
MTWFSRVLLALVVCVGFSRAQLGFSTGSCPIYQTSDWFNTRKISQIVADDGYLVALSLATEHASQKCARLQFYEGSSYVYSYVDDAGRQQERRGTYRSVPSGFTTAARIELSGLTPTMLGADVFGNTYLYPIYKDESGMEVYVSCTSYGLVHSERVYGLVPTKPGQLRTDINSVITQLTLKSIPQASSLRVVNQECNKINVTADTIGSQNADAAVADKTNVTADAVVADSLVAQNEVETVTEVGSVALPVETAANATST